MRLRQKQECYKSRVLSLPHPAALVQYANFYDMPNSCLMINDVVIEHVALSIVTTVSILLVTVARCPYVLENDGFEGHLVPGQSQIFYLCLLDLDSCRVIYVEETPTFTSSSAGQLPFKQVWSPK